MSGREPTHDTPAVTRSRTARSQSQVASSPKPVLLPVSMDTNSKGRFMLSKSLEIPLTETCNVPFSSKYRLECNLSPIVGKHGFVRDWSRHATNTSSSTSAPSALLPTPTHVVDSHSILDSQSMTGPSIQQQMFHSDHIDHINLKTNNLSADPSVQQTIHPVQTEDINLKSDLLSQTGDPSPFPKSGDPLPRSDFSMTDDFLNSIFERNSAFSRASPQNTNEKLDQLIDMVQANARSINSFTSTRSSSADNKLDKMIVLLQNSASSISILRDQFISLQSELNATSKECHERINLLESQTEKDLLAINDQVDGAFGYVDSRMDLIFTAKSDHINSQFIEASEATDALIQHNITELRGEVLLKIDELANSLENKLDSYNRSLSTTIQFEIEHYLDNKGPETRLDSSNPTLITTIQNEVVQHLEGLNLDETIQKEIVSCLGNAPATGSPTPTPAPRGTGAIKLQFLEAKLDKSVSDIEEIKRSLNFSSDPNVQNAYTIQSADLSLIQKKLDSLTNWLSAFQRNQRAKNTIIDSLDLRSRVNNLIIDGMEELPQEDTPFQVGQLLTRFVPHFDNRFLVIAYRIGKFVPNRPPRRIFTSFTPGPTRNLVLSCAGLIAKAGLPGARIYINEDVPEGIKRRKSDIFKYVEFLKEKGITAIQKGENVLIDGRLYKFEELKNMPPGLTLKDSRTIKKNGVIAFQSSHSPLSNLYMAPLKRNGITYLSAEHAFQHAKAVICKDQALAHSILEEPCSYEALYTGKRIQSNEEWSRDQLTTMEEILRAKYEQVPDFRNELRGTENNHLIENTRCPFWGSGTTFNALSLFSNSYPGSNHLGRLLVKIRDHF